MNLKLQKLSKMFMAFLMALFSVWGYGQHPITGFGTANTYNQSFDTFRGTAATLPSEWSVSGSYNSNPSYQILTAGGTSPTTNTANGNNVYAGRASTTSSDYSLLQKQGTSGSSTFTFSAVNNTNNTINGFVINWNVEQFSLGGRPTQVNFRYRIGSGAYTQTGITGTTLYTSATGSTATNFAYVNSTPTGYSITINDLTLAANQTIDFQFYVTNGSGGGSNSHVGIDDFSVYATQINNNLPAFATTGTFGTFTYVEGNGPSSSQSIKVSGNNLDNSDVTVVAPTNYEVSLTNNNDFSDNKTITYSGGTFTDQNIYVRLKSALTSGAYTGNSLTISGGGASVANIALTGSVVPPPPVNDLCLDATVLTSGNTLTGSMINATATSGLTASPTKKDVWYKYTALNSGDHAITANFPSGVDLDIHIYTGSCPTSGSATYVGQTVGGMSEVLTASLISGTDYYIRVIDYDENATAFTITLQEPLPCVAPSVATNLNLTSTSTDISGTFTNNNASGYMVVLSSLSTLSSSPVNGTVYNVGDTFAGGTIVKYSAGSTFIATNLNQSTNYNVFVFSYNNQCVGEPFYNAASLNGTSTTLSGPCINENFDGVTPPAQWTMESISYGGQNCGTSGSGMVFNSSGDFAITPAVTNPLSLSFGKRRSGNSTSWSMKIQYSTSNTSTATWTDITTISTISTNCDVENIDLSILPAGTYYIRFLDDRASGAHERTIDNVQIFCSPTTPSATTWNGTAWSNGAPATAVNAIFTGSYSTASQPAFNANNITIQNGGILEITSGNTINAVDVTVENGGNLIQKDGSTLTITGVFKVLKNGVTAQNRYAFWSSPVVSQNLATIYGAANTPQFITEYNTATDYFITATSNTSVFGKGYSIKTPAVSNVTFEGAPNNGTQTFTLNTVGNGFNLIGNPYPSNLNLTAFYNANSASISETFYFWDHTSNSVITQNGATTTNIGYATYNTLSSAWTSAPNITTLPTGTVANVGQGFIVKAKDASVNTALSFNNEMRVATTGSFFNKNNTTEEGKFWLRLNSSYNTNNTFAIVYINGASNSYDNYDSKAIGIGSDAFYTLADAQKLVIQGKSGFNTDDVVPVGAKHFENGNFTISLVQKEGLFNNGQAIYLHDKVNNTYTDLQNGAYSFTANAGEITDRFEIVYKLNVLATAEVKKEAFEVYRDGEDFFIRNDKNIEKVEIFDASGRKVQEVKAQSKLVKVNLDKGVYILKATSAGKDYTKKLIK